MDFTYCPLTACQVFEGVPEPFDMKKRMVVPAALKVLHSKSIRKTTSLDRLATEAGWKHSELIKKLEAERITKAQAFYAEKKAEINLKAKAEKAAAEAGELDTLNPVLQGFGYYMEPTAVGATKALKAEVAATMEFKPAVDDMEEEKEGGEAAAPAAGGDY